MNEADSMYTGRIISLPYPMEGKLQTPMKGVRDINPISSKKAFPDKNPHLV